jgi:hypothetical protein
MGYTLERLAPGSYDVLLDGTIAASQVQSNPPERRGRRRVVRHCLAWPAH